MTRPEIIELALQLAERKGERVLQVPALYRFVLQDICKRQRFWWRRIQFSFQLTQGTATYDLTSVTTTPSGAMTEIMFDEITKFTVILATNPYQVAEMTAVFDPEALIDMVNNTTLTSPNSGNNTNPGGRYTMDTSGINTIRIDPPDLNYTAYIVGWAMPNPANDSTNDAVPLIPAWGHNTIVSGIAAKLLNFSYGSANPKTIAMAAEYEQGIADMIQRKQFDPNYRSQLSLSEDAVRST